MKWLVILMLSVLVISCNKTEKHQYKAVSRKCGSYGQGIKEGRFPDKTTTVQVGDTLFKMDYVRDHEGKWVSFSSYGTSVGTFAVFLEKAGLSKRHPEAANVSSVVLYGANNNIEKAEALEWKNVVGYSVYYKGADDYAYMEFTNLKTHTTKNYKVSEGYASVKNYLAKQCTGTLPNPSIISFTNTDFADKGTRLIDVNDDALYAEVKGQD